MASMSLQAAYDQARQSLESNNLDRAIGLAQHILGQYPDNLEAYRILGEAYLANRQLDRAGESFERVLRSDPENIPAHVGLGITAERQGQLDRAIGEFEQALEIKPDMTELRSQLLRLYSENFGSDNAQLRLSRAGLARLYAKGHMLPQAISEFRQVINDQPGRFDAMVALAEALWRDGQEDDAIDLCRDILAERPESLKANLLLGYLLSSSGRPEGERYWQSALRMDPYQGVAHALFETLPQQDEQPMVEEWDEDAWRSRRAADQQEQIAATRPMEAVTPSGTPADATPGPKADWPEPVAAHAPVAAAAAPDTDDFLASLLALDNAPPPPSSAPAPISEEELGLDADMQPFSFEDLDRPKSTPPSSGEPAPAEAEPALTPFSLSDLGLSDEEIASMGTSGAAPEASQPTQPAAEDDEPTLTPFSLSDLGLSDDEIAGLGIPGDAAARPAQPAAEDDEPALTPFSLSDLGLSDDEIAGLDSLRTGSAQGAAPSELSSLADDPDDANDLPADLMPFSFDELDLNTEDDASSRATGLPSSLQPFSLEDTQPPRPRVSGFGTSEAHEDAEDEDSAAEPRGFSWHQAAQKPEPGFAKPPREEPPAGDVSIFSKLKQRHENLEPRPEEPLPPVSLEPDEHLGLFSVDDVPLRDDTTAQPAAEPAAPAEIDNLQDALASGQIQPFSFADLGLTAEEMALLEGEQAAPAEAAPKTTPAPEIENLDDALASGQIQPFSLSDLGLSDEEIAAMGMSAPTPPQSPAAPPEPPPAQIDDFDVELAAPPASSAAVPGDTAADEEPLMANDLKPFSLTDLGLSDEEIEALGLDVNSSLDESDDAGLGLTEEELEGLDGGDLNWSQQPQLLIATPVQPSAPEPAAPTAEQLEPQITSGDLVVDRLIALGRQQGYIDISDIIANFEDPEAEAARIEEIGMRLHEAKIEIRDGDEVIDMDAEYADDAQDNQQPAAEPAPPRSPTLPRDLDLVTADAEPASDEPALTPFSLSELGLTDEEIAALGLDEPASAEPASPPPATPASDEPALTPFSLSELGLTDEEIAALGLGETPAAPEDTATPPAAEQPAAPMTAEPAEPPATPASDEPVLTPFSLSELGLTDEEIAALGLGETLSESTIAPDAPEQVSEEPSAAAPDVPEQVSEEPSAAAPNEPEQVSEEPAMTPFSLSELGLTDDEIASLGFGESSADTTSPAAPEQQAPSPAEPAEQPAAQAEPPVEAAAPEPAPAPPPEPAPAEPLQVAPPTIGPPAERPARDAARPTARGDIQLTGNDVFDMFIRQLEGDPNNDVLRLSVARVGAQIGLTDIAVQQYKYLVKHNRLLDQVVVELQDLIADNDDAKVLQRLHRTLGDVYSKQGHFREAIEEYSWTLGGPRGAR